MPFEIAKIAPRDLVRPVRRPGFQEQFSCRSPTGLPVYDWPPILLAFIEFHEDGGMRVDVSEVLVLVGGHVDSELLLRTEYLAAENEVLRSQLSTP